jgi:hypothetical protein
MMNLRSCLLLMVLAAYGSAQTISLAPGQWKANKVKAQPVNYKGKAALRVTDDIPSQRHDEDRLVILNGGAFRDGVIELEVAGEPGPDAPADARGFVGVAFRVAPDISKFECFYLRPTNARADDQVRRNHSAQYIAFPEFPWARLRKEFAEKYESYVDLEPGAWTKVRVEVRGAKGTLFVHGNAQPTLVINDLKLDGTAGAIALWTGPGTLAHFANVRRAP